MVDANGEPRHLTVTGLLLAGREEAIQKHLPNSEIAFQVLSGIDLELNGFFRQPLCRSFSGSRSTGRKTGGSP